MSMNTVIYENEQAPDYSHSLQNTNTSNINYSSEDSVINGESNIRIHETPNQPDSDDYNLINSDFSNQSSENPSPLTNEQVHSLNNLQYMGGGQFFVDDASVMDHNNYLDNLTPDQQLAIKELELRKLLSEFEDDYDFNVNYDQILDYDVREKLETLNAQLANEPSPPEPEHRNSRVAFKEELISSVAPPDDYDLSESDFEEPNELSLNSRISPAEITEESSYLSQDINPDDTTSKRPNENTTVEEDSSYTDLPISTWKEENCNNLESDLNSNKKRNVDSDIDNDLNIVISRGGQFQLIGQNDMIDSTDNNKISHDHDTMGDDFKNFSKRPISAPVTKRNRNEAWSNLDSSDSSMRSDSIYRLKQSDRQVSNIPRIDRDLLKRQKEREERRKREEKEKAEEEYKNKKELNDKCFNAWLQKKNKISKEELERKKKEDEEEEKQKEKNQEERKLLAQEKERELTKHWEQLKRREEKLRQYRLKEIKESMNNHTEDECKKAFREWLKKKNQSRMLKLKEEKQKARVTRLAMRQCRKSQNLAQAIHQANSFRYLDFYGYP